MPPKNANADKRKAAEQKIADKTFGMKNKNKSKAVQSKIQQMNASLGNANQYAQRAADKKKLEAAAMEQVLFKEAVSKKELERRKQAKALAAIEKAQKAKEPEKRDIFVDSREAKLADDMATWDEEKLRSVVESKKKGGQGERVKTDIICKHFIDAVEKRTYGWFWECPNGGDKCQYRHALPEDYVLKRDKVQEMIVEDTSLEDGIEEKRKALTTRTPVTFERLQAWLEAKKAAIAAEESTALESARSEYAKGKRSGVSGRMLFDIDKSIFDFDDASADVTKYVRDEEDDEYDAEDRGGNAPAMGGDGDEGGAGEAGGADVGAEGIASEEQPGLEEIPPGLEGVDESLFLEESDDLPEDDELED